MSSKKTQFYNLVSPIYDYENIDEINKDGDGLIIPKSVFNNIIKTISVASPMFNFVHKCNSELSDDKNAFGSYVQFTQNIINNLSADEIVHYTEKHAISSMAAAINKILTGKKTANFVEPIIDNPKIQKFVFNGAQPTINEITKMSYAFYSSAAVWIVSPRMEPFITSLRHDNFSFDLLGSPVIVDDALTGTSSEIIYGDLKSAYTLNVEDNMTIKDIDKQTILLKTFVNGKINNPDRVGIGVFEN